MIEVTRRDGQSIVLNAEEILHMEQLADVVVVLRDGNRLFVKESVDEIACRVIYYRQQIHNPKWARQQAHPLNRHI